ncbi:hypothetical protein UlMin_024062 [Ulmus minor]
MLDTIVHQYFVVVHGSLAIFQIFSTISKNKPYCLIFKLTVNDIGPFFFFAEQKLIAFPPTQPNHHPHPSPRRLLSSKEYEMIYGFYICIYAASLMGNLSDNFYCRKIMELGGLKKLDSFGRWMDEEISIHYDDSLMASDSANFWNTLDAENDDNKVSSLSRHMQLDVESLGPSLSQEQLFSICDFSPDWAYSNDDRKVLIAGRFLGSKKHSDDSKWGCMFGEIEVLAEVLTDNVIRCQTPSHAPGRVPFYVTCRNTLACSEVRDFEFQEKPLGIAITPKEEVRFQIWLGKLLNLGPEGKCLDCSIALGSIVTAGTNPNFSDTRGRTGLHWASYFGREETVAALVKLGAAPGSVDDPTPTLPGVQTASDLASSRGHRGIAACLAKADLMDHLVILDTNEELTDSLVERIAAESAAEAEVEVVTLDLIVDNHLLKGSLKYRGWKGRRKFLKIRDRVLRLQWSLVFTNRMILSDQVE